MRVPALALRTGGFARPLPGYQECGDAFVVVETDERVLVGMIDGLGHGPLAAVAAEQAVATVRAHRDLDVADLMAACHQALRPTRGAAVALLELRPDGRCRFCGVGNVEVAVIHGQLPRVFSYPGIVGHNLRPPKTLAFEVRGGDAFCLHTDGVRGRVGLASCADLDPVTTARRIVESHGRLHDDAAALVVAIESAAGGPDPSPPPTSWRPFDARSR